MLELGVLAGGGKSGGTAIEGGRSKNNTEARGLEALSLVCSVDLKLHANITKLRC
jgi:hypothetical protein